MPMNTYLQPSFFDVETRTAKLTEMGDPLVGLNARIDWEAFRSDLNRVHNKARKNNAGARPHDVILMFKILVLQQLHNLSDERIEYQIRDRLSFMRFLGLQLESKVPDAKTVWLFREYLKELNLMEALFNRFHEQLAQRGYVAKAGQMIDASFVEAPKQRNTRKENALIKENAIPIEWGKDDKTRLYKLTQKDTDARWAKKGNEIHYGFKNHINADQTHKLIQTYTVTDAAVHDACAMDDLLDTRADANGAKRPVYADSAYRSTEREAALAEQNITSQICEKGNRGHPLTEVQKIANRAKSKVRSRVEHIFWAQAQMGGLWVRTIGLLRAKVKIGMMNLVYNMMRLVQLIRRDGIAASAIGEVA